MNKNVVLQIDQICRFSKANPFAGSGRKVVKSPEMCSPDLVDAFCTRNRYLKSFRSKNIFPGKSMFFWDFLRFLLTAAFLRWLLYCLFWVFFYKKTCQIPSIGRMGPVFVFWVVLLIIYKLEKVSWVLGQMSWKYRGLKKKFDVFFGHWTLLGSFLKLFVDSGKILWQMA